MLLNTAAFIVLNYFLINYYVNVAFIVCLSEFLFLSVSANNILVDILDVQLSSYLATCLFGHILSANICLIIGRRIHGWDQYFVVTH